MFKEMPRYVGFPNQLWVESKLAFRNFETMFKGLVPFFVSHYRFKDPETPIVDNMFFDIDSYYSVRFPYRNSKILRHWSYKNDIPYLTNYSGGKGYHNFLFFKPIVPKNQKEYDELKDILYSLQMKIAEEVGMESFDEPTFGRLRFLVRYPTSKYVRKDEDTGAFTSNGMYCRNLTDKEFDLGVKRLSKVVKTPGIVPRKPRTSITLDEIIDCFDDFEIIKRADKNKGLNINLQRNGEIVPNIQSLGLPCLQEIVKHPHPTHYERIELVAWLKHLGYTDLAINAFIRKMNWTRYKYSVTSYQVRTVKPRMVKCSFLRKGYGHLCSKCPFKKSRW